MFYSKMTGGFYDAAIHGARKLSIVDPAFVWPQVEVENPQYDSIESLNGQTIMVNDPTVIPPMIEIDNPDCKIPADAVEISAEDHAALIDGQYAGKRIVADANGHPILQDPPKATAADVWERIKAERDRRIQSGYKVGTKWFHSDTFSRTQQMGLVMLGANIPANTPWKTMDGTTVTMTQALAGQIFAAAAASDIAIFAAAEMHRAAMESSADPSSYDFSAGWPKVFGE